MASFRCDPPIVKFSKFSSGSTLRRTLNIINSAPAAQRFGALLLAEEADREYWRLEFEPQGSVAPGASILSNLIIYSPPGMSEC